MKRTTIKQKRQLRVRLKIKNFVSSHSSEIKAAGFRPRLSVFRSNRAIYAQIIDDGSGKTLVAVSQKDLPKEALAGKKAAIAFEAGKTLAQKAKKKEITLVVFDRGRFAYHGRVKALADGAREGGLQF